MRTHWLWLLAAGGCTAAPDDAGILSPVNLAALNADIDGHELDVEWIDQPVVPGLDGAWQARTGGLRTYLLPDRLVTMDRRSGGDGWTVSLATARWGRGDALEPVGGGTVWTDGPAFESRRPGWTEWTESTAVGLEHGYTLYDRPAGAGPVVIELDTDAERVVPTRDADGVALWVGGGPVVGWRDLVAYDAAGQRLDASVGAVGTTIRVEVDDGGAVWPLTIDPLVTNEVAQGTPVLGGPNPSRFATSIDLDGSQMIVGDPGIPGPGTVGAAWVMVTNGATVVPWTAASELVPDGQANDVGRAVAVEGQYAAVAVDGTIQFFRHESTGGAEWSYDGEVTISLGTGQVQAMAFADGRLLAGVPSSGADGGAVVSVTRFGSLASPWSIPQQALGTIPNAQLGSAIAADGSRFVAGAPGNNKVKVYRLGTGLVSDFSEVATLSDPDGGGAHRFGSAVAIAGDVVAVGAPGGNHVTVFERTTGDTFGAGTEIEAPWAGIQGFGAGVALDGGLLVVTDHRTDTEPSSVYIYEWVTGSSWGLRESHPIGESIEAPPPVRLNENWVVVGVPGSAAYRVWRREGDALVDQLDSSTALSRYGAAVSVSGRFAAVGAPFDDSAGPDGGKVFVYERTDSEFWLRRNTVSILQSESAHLGQAVDIESEFLAVGAPFDDLSTAPGVGTMRGSVRVFQFDGTSFVLQTTLDSSDFGVSATSDQFGSAVAIDATGVVVGFPGLDVAQGNTNQGGAAVYANADGAITPLTLIEGANNGDQMGRVVGIDAGRIFVGSDLADAAAGRLEVWEFPPEGALPVQSVVLSGAAGDRLGRSMSIEGNLLAVGATGANLGAGKVIVYAVDGNAGYIEQDRFGPMGANGFGEAVAFAGSRLYVGSQAGIKAWRYELVLDSANALWSQEAEILGPAGASSFGKAIAADDDVVLIGDELNDATHFYRLDGEGPPVARPDSYVYPEGSVHSVDAASGLLANDTDPDGDTLTVTGEDAPAYVTIHPDGSLDIDPPADYFGRDVITYEVTANGDAVESTVIVQITNVNDAPTATAPLAPFVVAYGGGLHVQPASDGLLAPGLADDVDNDLLHVELQTGPAHGTFTLNDDGSFEYTPQDGFPGLWTFTYEVCDQSLCTSTLTASIDVHNDPPVGVPEIAWAAFAEDSQFALGAPGLLSEQYVTDTEHDPLTAEVAELPDHGTLLLE
ncbi:MAG: Ig-like domain-containing protein, partial [Myxococcota bacterium]